MDETYCDGHTLCCHQFQYLTLVFSSNFYSARWKYAPQWSLSSVVVFRTFLLFGNIWVRCSINSRTNGAPWIFGTIGLPLIATFRR